MRPTLSIKHRLLLLLFLAIVLVLALVGSSLDFFLHRYYKNLSDEHFTRLFSGTSLELENRKRHLSRSMSEFARRDDVISSVNLISRHASEHSDAQVLDREKQTLAQEVRNQALASGIGQIAVYDGAGSLLAFFSNQGEESSDFVSDTKDAPLIYVNNGEWAPSSLPRSFEVLNGKNGVSPGTSLRRGPEGLAIESTRPVVRMNRDGSKQTVGQLTGKEFLGDEFVQSVTRNSDAVMALYFDDGAVIGNIRNIDVRQLKGAMLMDPVHPGAHSEIPNLDYYLAAIRVPLRDGGNAYIVSGIPKNTINDAIARNQAILLLVLLLSALFIMPTGAVAARRMISEPVDRLVESARALHKGDFSRKVAVAYKDELGHLADTFNGMAEAVNERQKALAESENRYRTLMDNMPASVCYKDRDFIYRSCNRRYVEDLGLTVDELIGKMDYDLYPKETADRIRERDCALVASGEVIEFDEQNLSRGRMHIMHTVKTPVRDDRGDVMGILGVHWDITAQKRDEERLRQSAAVFESTAEGVIITGADKRIIAVNKAFTEITGFSSEEALGHSPKLLRSDRHDTAFFESISREVERTGRWQGEIWNRRKTGEIHPEWMTISVVRDEKGEIVNYVAVFSDISPIKRSQAQLDYLAHHDPLTDLPNRLLFVARLEHAIGRAQRTQRCVAVLFLDLDRFKNVNDTLGHPTGDLLLQNVAKRLRTRLRESDTIARLGGDEFVVTVEDLRDKGEAVIVAQKLLEIFNAPFHLQGSEIHLGASIGISLFPRDAKDVATLVKYADTAMYLAKEQGRNTYRFYTSLLGVEAQERFHLESALRRAVERGELELFYQPQVELGTGRILGAEALLRWHHPDLGLIPPERFVPLAEDTGLIVSIGDWALNSACEQYMRWWKSGLMLDHIAVNLSGIQVQRGDLVRTVTEALARTGMPPGALELEMTESVVVEHPEFAAGILNGLRELGVALAIDDFGTGYSSLSYLKRFAPDAIKIDKSFVQGIPNVNDGAIIKAVIALADSLQMGVIAEGIEKEEQRDFLVAQGCRRGQGYLFGAPLSAAEFEPALQKRNGLTERLIEPSST